ncbi:MAG: gamma-butyrobetaine hydroxylase [Gammaproteobacteria bacterium]|nr:MAG: gamma-butyrobetaine hydroxylase [Gammaproteobacteria bacterium]
MLNIRKNNDNSYHITMSDQHLPALWIRERAQDETQVDQRTQQRLMNPHLLPADLSITNASVSDDTLSIGFSDGYQGNYNIPTLLSGINASSQDEPEIKAWQVDDNLDLTYDWQLVNDDEKAFFKSVNDFLTYGYIILKNTPTEAQSILDIATQYGFVRDTNFGRYFEVYSRHDANDLAYTPHAIGPHTDNPYRDPVPGIQLLHCLINETSGGFSTLVDSITVAETLKAEDPKGYQLLSQIAVRFRFFDKVTELVSHHPIIEEDHNGNIMGIHYSPRLDDLPLLDEPSLQAYQAARKRLSELLEDPCFEKKFKLDSGELMMFDNNRVLHGRTSFDPSEGYRHLQGCYIDRDAPRSHYRLLARKYL